MADIVVTVPKTFTHPNAPGQKGLAAWIAEGDAAGDEPSGQQWAFRIGGAFPDIKPGERVYVVCEGKLRGYSELVDIVIVGATAFGPIDLIRGSHAEAVTIDDVIRGFQGWRYRWWERSQERPFPDWRTP